MAKHKKKEGKKTADTKDQEVKDSNELLSLIRLQIAQRKSDEKERRAKELKIPERE